MKYLRSAMRRSKQRKPPSLQIKPPSRNTRDTSPRCPSVLSDWDADDEGFMSSAEFLPARPLSLSIPAGSNPRRPTLQEVLSGSAPPPWTLGDFMAYLSTNHCLETLEFTMDAARYKKYYHEMVEKSPHTPVSPQSKECEMVRNLWQKLLDAYIAENGPREVNLPSDVKYHLMALPYTITPPEPAELEPAVKIIYELMEESVLVPFLNSVVYFHGNESTTSPNHPGESMVDTYMTGSLDDHSFSPGMSSYPRGRSPPSGGSSSDLFSQSQSGTSPHHSRQSHLSTALARSGASRLSAYLSGSSGQSSGEGPESLTDDSTDSPSISGSTLEPMTPPSTPPTSHLSVGDASPGTSPRNSRESNSGWKKMGAKLGFKKSRSGQGSGSSTSAARYSPAKDRGSESGDSSL